jgi:hypothetical protein
MNDYSWNTSRRTQELHNECSEFDSSQRRTSPFCTQRIEANRGWDSWKGGVILRPGHLLAGATF